MKLIECPRDAMQGWKKPISTIKKVEYLRALLKVGFDTIDFGSFVSPKAIPQMADTEQVIREIEEDAAQSETRLLAIIANLRGAEVAATFERINYLGFPFSVSETFQQRNTNSSIDESLERVEDIQNLCVKTGKDLVVYLSMGFGNPYDDPYDEEIVFEWVNKLVAMDINIISLADTVGVATEEQVFSMTRFLVESLPGIEIGVHLHSRPDDWEQKLNAALTAGCKRFDGALKGIGGCPMANDDLVGNMDSEKMIQYFNSKGYNLNLNQDALKESLRIANEIFLA